MKNYYEILEVHQKASREVIEKAYKVLIKKYHPDLYTGSEKISVDKKAKAINEAYRVLSDDFLREQYDKELERDAEYSARNNNINTKKQQTDYINNELKNEEQEQTNQVNKTHKVGSLGSLVDLVGTIFGGKFNIKEIKKPKREDFIAAGLTLIIVIVVGVILWFIPATNGWIRTLKPF